MRLPARSTPRPAGAPSRAVAVLLLAAAAAYALAGEAQRVAYHYSLGWIVTDLVPGLAFFVVGIVAWRRRPGNRIGPLLFATGLAWFVGTWAVVADPTIGRIAGAFQGYYDPLLAVVVLAYPSGRLVGRPERLAVGAMFLVVVLRTLLRLAVFPLASSYDLAIGSEVDRYIADVQLRSDGEFVLGLALAAISLVVLVLVLRRLARASGASRRVEWPILAGGIAILAGTVLEIGLLFVRPDSAELRTVLNDIGLYITSATGLLVPLAFLFGLARTQLARGAVADLVVQLDDVDRSLTLREMLARAVGDPSLEIAYAVPGSGSFVGPDGAAMLLPGPERTDRAVTRLDRRGETIAALIHDPALAEEQALIRSVAAAARMALDNARLQAEVRAQLADVRASRARIVAAGDAERRRIERDLHDGAQQRLVTLALAIDMARRQAPEAGDGLARLLDEAAREVDGAMSELRDLARGVHPTILVEAGLDAAVEALADRSPVPVRTHGNLGGRRLSPEIEAAAYFVVSESLANVAKHAQATMAAVQLAIAPGPERLVVTVTDDGVGGANADRGSGITGLADRVAAVGGRLRVDSPGDGGTVVTAELPCA